MWSKLPERPTGSSKSLGTLQVLQLPMSRHAAVESQRTYPIGVSTNQLHLAVRYLQYDDPPPEKDRVQLPVRI
jgi:hypothetical protein